MTAGGVRDVRLAHSNQQVAAGGGLESRNSDPVSDNAYRDLPKSVLIELKGRPNGLEGVSLSSHRTEESNFNRYDALPVTSLNQQPRRHVLFRQSPRKPRQTVPGADHGQQGRCKM